MTARVTLCCPGCGVEWELAIPEGPDQVTEELCECDTRLFAFRLSSDSGAIAIVPPDRPAEPRGLRELVGSSSPRRVGEILGPLLTHSPRREKGLTR